MRSIREEKRGMNITDTCLVNSSRISERRVAAGTEDEASSLRRDEYDEMIESLQLSE